MIFQLNLFKIRKTTDFKSLRIKYWEIIRVTSKCQMDFFGKTCKKKSKIEKENITIEFYIFELA